MPRDALPRLRNPEIGWVVTCNQKVVDADYPHFMSVAFAPEYRAKVLVEYINKCKDKMGIENMLENHNQKFSIPAEKMIIFLRTLDMTDINFSEIETNSFEALTSWNFEIDKESFEACIYLVMKEKLIEKIISLNYGSLSDEIINWNNVGGCLLYTSDAADE